MPFCKNHPEKFAKRVCYFCKEPICPSCQIRLHGHIFCSPLCGENWRKQQRREEQKKRWERWKQNIDPRIWWRYPPFARPSWARRTMVFLYLLLFLQGVTALLLFMLLKEKAPGRESLAHATPLSSTSGKFYSPPRWIEPPRGEKGIVTGVVEGGEEPAYLLRNGTPIIRIPEKTRIVFRDHLSSPPVHYFLAPLSLLKEGEIVLPGGNIDQIPSTPGVALTFDGGSRGDQTREILRILREKRVRVTIFLTGKFIEQYPEETREIAYSGHEVGNHTYSHPHLTYRDPNGTLQIRPEITKKEFQWELLRTEQIFYRTTGIPMVPLFRAPYGEIHPTILQWAEEIGYQHIGWTRLGKKGTLDTLDWVSDPEDPLYLPGSATVKKILTQLKDPAFRGGIILMHLGVERKEDRVQDYLPELIDGIRGLSLPILPVSELLLFSP